MDSPLSYLPRPDGGRIAYRRTEARPTGGRPDGPEVVFLGGFASDMTGTKARHLETACLERGLAFTRFDYAGHGASSGRFEDGTIGDWTTDALAVIDELSAGPLILVGSSMGGWIMLLVARSRPERVAGLVGVAAAADFTQDLIDAALRPEDRDELEGRGFLAVPSPHLPAPAIYTRALIEEGRDHLVLRAPLAIDVPVHLLHGLADAEVPWTTSLTLAERLTARDVTVELVKDGDHRLSRQQDLERLTAALDRVIARAG